MNNYELIVIDDVDAYAIKLLDGPYKDIVYCYGSVGVVEESGVARLKFDYIVIDSGNFTVEDLTEDENFSTILGDILVEMITVEGQNDTPGNNDSKESDLL